ncbi:hypothetical protein ACEYW6_36375 [Nostoc sp. UIC 10607]|nr:hypothetical protein [Nostoc foliaceum]
MERSCHTHLGKLPAVLEMLSRSVGDAFGGCSHRGHRFAVKVVMP